MTEFDFILVCLFSLNECYRINILAYFQKRLLRFFRYCEHIDLSVRLVEDVYGNEVGICFLDLRALSVNLLKFNENLLEKFIPVGVQILSVPI